MLKKCISVRIDEGLFLKLRLIAENENRSISSQAMIFVRQSVNNYEKEKGKTESES